MHNFILDSIHCDYKPGILLFGKSQVQREKKRLNREDAKGAKGFIYFLIGTDDQEKNHALLVGYQRDVYDFMRLLLGFWDTCPS